MTDMKEALHIIVFEINYINFARNKNLIKKILQKKFMFKNAPAFFLNGKNQ